MSEQARPTAWWTLVVSVALAGATAIIARLACLPFGAFPDERMHAQAAVYYRAHWLPPGVSELLVPYLDSLWGASYLQTWPPQAVYFIWGKLSLLCCVPETHLWVFIRAFNVALWLCVAAFAFRQRARLPAVFLAGATAQFWYVFSYAASDAFTAVVAIVVFWQLSAPEGAARRFLNGTGGRGALISAALPLALLVLSKTTNMFALLLATARASAIALSNKGGRRFLLAIAIVTVASAPFLVADAVRSGANREAKMTAYSETYAQAPFKPSGHLAPTVHFSLALRERGVAWSALFHKPWRWADLLWMSFLGLYGAMSILAPHWLYVCQSICWVALLIIIGCGVVHAPGQTRYFAAGAALTTLALIAADFWHSWSYDFQPQGRYLFSVIALTAGLWLEVDESGDRLARPVLAALLAFNLISFAYGATALLSSV